MGKVFKITLFTLICASLWGCYRMPTEDDYSMIPLTNNRDFTREKQQALPGVGY